MSRESVLEQVRRRVVVEAVSRVHTAGEPLLVRGEGREGSFFLANGEGDHHVVAWNLDGVVAFAFEQDRAEGQDNLAPSDRTPEELVPGAPEGFAPLVAAAADACARLATGGLWLVGETCRAEGTTDALDDYLVADVETLPPTWISMAGLSEDQARLAHDLGRRSQHGHLTLGDAEVAALVAAPSATADITTEKAERAAKLLAWAGITWPDPAATAQRAREAAIGRLTEALGPLGSELFAASLEGDLGDVSDLVDEGADVDRVFPAARPGDVMPGETPLIVATRRGHREVAARLLEAGADPDAGQGWRALDWAAHRGDAALCRALLAAGADVSRGTNEWPPLQHAVSGRSADVVRQLLDAGANLPPPYWCDRLADMLRALGAEDLVARVTRPAPEWWAPLCDPAAWRPRPGTMVRPRVSGACVGVLARAEEALSAGQGLAALDALREHWEATRHPRVADALDQLSCRLGQHLAWPDAHDRIDEVATVAWLDVVANEPADPRRTAGILSFLQRGHFYAQKGVVARCVERAAEALVHLLDVRYVAALAELPTLGRASTHWVHALRGVPAPLSAAQRELGAFVPGNPSAEDAAILTRIEDLLARRHEAPRGRRAVHDLLRDVWENPDDDGPRQRLAVRLVEAGDPRGELITLQLARAGTAKKPTRRERELLEEHGRAWCGRIAGVLERCDFERGFPARVATGHPSLKPGQQTYEPPRLPDGVGTQDEWSTVTHLSLWRQTHGTGGLLRSPKLRALRHVADVERDVGLLLEGPPLRWESLSVRSVAMTRADGAALARTLPALRDLDLPLPVESPDELLELTANWRELRHLAVRNRPEVVGGLAAVMKEAGLTSLRVRGGWTEVAVDLAEADVEVRFPGKLVAPVRRAAAAAVRSLVDAGLRTLTVVVPRRARVEGQGADAPSPLLQAFSRGRERVALDDLWRAADEIELQPRIRAWHPVSWSPVPESLGLGV